MRRWSSTKRKEVKDEFCIPWVAVIGSLRSRLNAPDLKEAPSLTGRQQFKQQGFPFPEHGLFEVAKMGNLHVCMVMFT